MLEKYPYEYIYLKSGKGDSSATVCISLFNYQNHIIETLETVYKQTEVLIDVVIVDDQSEDSSLAVAEGWIKKNACRFNNLFLVQHDINAGLSAARNTAASIAKTPYVFILDADNLLFPRCIERCVESLEADPNASVAYPIIEKFGEEQELMGNIVWSMECFKQKK